VAPVMGHKTRETQTEASARVAPQDPPSTSHLNIELPPQQVDIRKHMSRRVGGEIDFWAACMRRASSAPALIEQDDPIAPPNWDRPHIPIFIQFQTSKTIVPI
jgi:hypothetical protein